MPERPRGFRALYGAGPAHLLVSAASLAICAYALWRVLGQLSDPLRFLVWLAGAIVAHDLLLYPLYALLGLIAGRASGVVRPERLRIAALNHLRLPALLSGLLLLVWFPLIAGKGAGSFTNATGLPNDVYLGRWLLVTALLFGGSALLLAVRVRRLR